jgi:hypothetical protein
MMLVSDVEAGGSGEVYVYLRSGSSYALVSSETLSAPAGVSQFGDSIALRPDATELAESGDMPPHVTIYAHSCAGFSPSSNLTLPTGAPHNFNPAVALASDGTLFVGASETASIYIYSPH